MPAPEEIAPTGWTGPERAWACTLVLLLTVLLALTGAFLVPFRVGSALVPVCWVVAVVGNLAVGWAGARVAGSLGALVPGLLWLGLAFLLGSRRAEGDLVVPGNTVGQVFLLSGALASAVAYGLAAVRAQPSR